MFQMTKKKHKLYIEPRDSGFAVLREGAQRASFIEPTQAKAEKRALKMDPTAGLDVSRVKYTKRGKPGQFRGK
jgi:hypothetical protein